MRPEDRSAADTRIYGPMADASLGFAFYGYETPKLPCAPLVRCTFGAREFAAANAAVEEAGEVLEVRFCSEGGERGDRFRLHDSAGSHPATLRFADGTQATAEFAVMLHQTHHFGSERPSEYVLALRNWSRGDASAARIWAGRLQGGRAFNIGNLSLIETSGGTAGHERVCHRNLRLSGNYVWHLLGDEQSPVVLIDGSKPFNREELRRDFQALEFIVGAPLKLDRLTGVDACGGSVATVGLGFGFRSTRSRRVHDGPVTDRFSSNERWLPVLFSRLARQPAERFFVSLLVMGAFIDARVDHIDGGYLKQHVALEAFCHEILEAKGPTTLVKDTGAWEAWVTSRQSEIKAHAIDDTADALAAGRRSAATKLVGKVRAAQQAPATDAVEATAAQFGLKWPGELTSEVGKRSKVAHHYMMNKQAARDIHVDVQRVTRLEVAMMSILSKYVGYDGPIAGWERDSGGWRIDPSWWPAPSPASLEEALRTFHCINDITAPDARPELW